jgi:hypothetical protein
MMRHGSIAALLVTLGTLVSAPGAQAQEKLSTWSGYSVQSPNLTLPAPPHHLHGCERKVDATDRVLHDTKCQGLLLGRS